MNSLKKSLQISSLIGTLLLCGCGGEPYSYTPENELKPGPGLLSGEDGEFNLVGSPNKENEQEKKKK